MPAAIYYHPEAYTTSGPKLMGRNAAGESFLRGFFLHSQTSEFWVQVHQRAHAEHFSQTAQGLGRREPVKAIDAATLGALAQPGLVYYPGPGIGEHAFHRAAFGHGAWSICGITHTTSSAGAMDGLTDLITCPVQPWDAVICTSTAVKDNVSRILQAQADYLQDRLGISRLVLPQLPVIPLGIHTEDFAFKPHQKATARSALGLPPDAIVVLFMGRLSFHAKAHPLAMYQALQAAAEAANRNVVLLECGWHANDYITKAYTAASQLAAPRVRVITLDGRNSTARQQAWAGADIFCSLSDNIQETFGIVPIEAMAAGLPVVVSDWDGYRDTVRDGIDGFRIPTLLPQAGWAGDLAFRHALEIDSYDMYCGHTCSLVAVDVAAATQAFTRLFQDAELRQQMGEAGRIRAREVYDWKPIIQNYERLWASLRELRTVQAAAAKPLPHPWPARMDPFHAFARYPTQTLTPATKLERVDADMATASRRVAAYRELAMVNFAHVVLPEPKEVEMILAAAPGPTPALSLVAGVDSHRQVFVLRSLAWLVKLGVLKVSA